MSVPNLSLTPSCVQIRKSILSTCAPIVDVTPTRQGLEKEKDSVSISIRAPLVIIGGPDSLYHPLHQGCLKWLCLGGTGKECIPRETILTHSKNQSVSQDQQQQVSGTIFVPSTIEDTVIFIHPNLLYQNNSSIHSAAGSPLVYESDGSGDQGGQQRNFVVLNTAEDAIESHSLSLSSSLSTRRVNTPSSISSKNHSSLVVRNALRSVHGAVHLSVRKSERENDHDPAELFKVVSFIDEMMRIPRGVAIAMPISASSHSTTSTVSSSSSSSNAASITDAKNIEITTTQAIRSPRLKQANSIVETFPIVQAFALQDVGPGGFLTMHHPILDNGVEIVKAIRHLDPHGIKRLIRSSLPALLRCWRLALASPGSIRDPLRRLTKFTEVSLAEPLSSFYKHTVGEDSGTNEDGKEAEVDISDENGDGPLFDVCVREKQVLALTRGGGSLKKPFVLGSGNLPSSNQFCKEARKEALLKQKKASKLQKSKSKPLPLGQSSRFLKRRLSAPTLPSSAMNKSILDLLEQEQEETNNDINIDDSTLDREFLKLPSIYSVLEFDDAASGLRCCRTILLRTNRPSLPLDQSASPINALSSDDDTEDKLLTALSIESIEHSYLALSSGLRKGVAMAVDQASRLEKKGLVQDALSVIAENIKIAILALLSSTSSSTSSSNFSSRLFVGVEAMDSTGETVATWNGETMNPSSISPNESSQPALTSFISRRHIFYAKALFVLDDSSILERFGFEEQRRSGGGGSGVVCFGDSFIMVSMNNSSSLSTDSSFTHKELESASKVQNADDDSLLLSPSPFSLKEQLYPSMMIKENTILNSTSTAEAINSALPAGTSLKSKLSIAARILTAEVPILSAVAVSGRASATAINAINNTIEEHITYDTYLKARQIKAAREAAESKASESAVGSYTSFRGVGKGRSGVGGSGGGEGGGPSTKNESSDVVVATDSTTSSPSVSSSAPLNPPPALQLYPIIQTLGHRLPCRTFNNVNAIYSHTSPFLSTSYNNIVDLTGMSLRLFEGGICLNHPTKGPNVISMECHVQSLYLIEGSAIVSDPRLGFPERNSDLLKKSQTAWIDAIESVNTLAQTPSSQTMSSGGVASSTSNTNSASADTVSETVLEFAKFSASVAAPGYSDIISGEGTLDGASAISAALNAPPDVLLLRLRNSGGLNALEACALGLLVDIHKSKTLTDKDQRNWIAILLPADQTEMRSNVLDELREWRTRIRKDDENLTANLEELPLSLLHPYTRLSPFCSSFSSSWEDQNLIELSIHSDKEEVMRAEKCADQLQIQHHVSTKDLQKERDSPMTLPVIIITGSLGGGPLAFANAFGKCLHGLPVVSSALNRSGNERDLSDGKNLLCVVDCSESQSRNLKHFKQLISERVLLATKEQKAVPSALLLVAPAACEPSIIASIIDETIIPSNVDSSSLQTLHTKVNGCIHVVHVGAGAPPRSVDLRGMTPITGLVEGLLFCTELVVLQAAGSGVSSSSIQEDSDAIFALAKRGAAVQSQHLGSSDLSFGSTAPFHALINIVKLPCSFSPSSSASPFVLSLSLGTAQTLFLNSIRNWSRLRSQSFRRIFLSHNIVSNSLSIRNSNLVYPSSVSHVYSRRQMEGSGATMGDDDEGVASLLRVDSYIPSPSSSSIVVTSKCIVEEQPLRTFLSSLISGSIDRASAALLGSSGISCLAQGVGLADRTLAIKEGERVAILEAIPSIKISFGNGEGIIPQTACYVTGLVRIAIEDDQVLSSQKSIQQPEGKESITDGKSPMYFQLALVTASPSLGVRISNLPLTESSDLSPSEAAASTFLSITGTGALSDKRVFSALTEYYASCRPILPALIQERERLDDRERQFCERAHATEFVPKDVTFDGVSYFDMNGIALPGHPLSEALCILHSSRRVALIRLWNNLQRRCEVAREREENDGNPLISFPTRDEIDWLDREETRARNLFIVSANGFKPPVDLESYSELLIKDLSAAGNEKVLLPWWLQLSRLKAWISSRNEKAPLAITLP